MTPKVADTSKTSQPREVEEGEAARKEQPSAFTTKTASRQHYGATALQPGELKDALDSMRTPTKAVESVEVGFTEVDIGVDEIGMPRRGRARDSGAVGTTVLEDWAGAEGDEVSNVKEVVDGPFRSLRLCLKASDPIFSLIVKWILPILLILFFAFIVFGVLYSGIQYHGGIDDDGTGRKCDSPFGTIIGAVHDVIGYSNCNDEYISDTSNYVVLPNGQQQYSGLAYQCVEYARRYLMLRGLPEPCFFTDVDGAHDIWSLSEVYKVSNPDETMPFVAYPNGAPLSAGGSRPQTGDLIIYPIQGNDFPFGHVAVIVSVFLNTTVGAVYVAEQNWLNSQWPKPYHNYTRSIPLVYNTDNISYTITDPDGEVFGWMRVQGA